MSTIKSENGRKWIDGFIALVSILVAFVFIRFTQQLGEWFDLESVVGHFLMLTQVVGCAVGVITFVTIKRKKKAMRYLDEVYGELLKVVWPDRDSVAKLTVGIVIGLAIVSGILVAIDLVVRKLLNFVY